MLPGAEGPAESTHSHSPAGAHASRGRQKMDKYSGQYMASHMMLELWLKIRPGEGIRHASGVGGCSVLYRVIQEGLTEAVSKRVMWT